MKKLFIKMALVLAIVLMPSLVKASEKRVFSLDEAKEMGYIAPSDSVYDRMYSVAVYCIGTDYDKGEFEHLATDHQDWELDILDDCASYRTVMEVIRYYFEQPIFWDTIGEQDWHSELHTLIEYWVKHDPSDGIMKDFQKFD